MPLIAGSSCRATRSGGAPASASARPASQCQAARTGAGDLLIQGGADEGVPEPQPGAGVCQDTRDARLVERREQITHSPAHQYRQVGHGEVDAEQRGRPQHLAAGGRHEAEPIGDRRGQ